MNRILVLGVFWLVILGNMYGQREQGQPLPNTNQTPKTTSDVPGVRFEGGRSLVFESFDRVSVKNYEKVSIQEVMFSGNVHIIFDGKKLKAQRVYVTIQSNKNVLHIAAFDEVEFRDENAIYLAQSFFYEPEKKTGRMRQVRSYLKDTTGTTTSPGLFYRAEEVEILSEKRAIFRQAHLTFTPADIPHYELYADTVWYFRDEVIFALHTSYMVGQQRLFYFPFFLRLEKMTGIKTVAGIEKRIGWYVMNTWDWSFAFGTMQFGLDFYERLGEYGFVRYANKNGVGPFQTLRFFGETADDVRLFYDPVNDRYSQWILINNEWTTIRQWGWHYMLEGAVQRENFTLTFYTEDLNDPFFSKKYAQRRETFTIQNILQPEENKFFSQSDNSAGYSSLNRRFAITSPQFSVNGQWTYQRMRNPEVSNIYLNDAYTYYLYQISFPNMTYTLPTIPLIDGFVVSTSMVETNRQHVGRVSVSASSNGDLSLTLSSQDSSFLPVTNSETFSLETNEGETNRVSFSSILVKTNTFEWLSVSSSVNGNLSYASSETLETNGMPISDSYHHQENASLSFNTRLLNRVISWDHMLSVMNRKRWSSFEINYSNNVLYSGAQVDYTMRTSAGTTPGLGKHPFWRVQFPLRLSHTFQYQLFRSIYQLAPREYSHAVSVSAGANWLSNIMVYSLSYSYQTTYRITNGIEDDYINNQIRETMNLSTSLGLWWFSFSTGITMDTLNRKTSRMDWHYPALTNRIVGSVVLENAFTPVTPWTYIPQIRYRYDLLRQTNLSLSLSSFATLSTWYLPFLYKVDTFAYKADLFIDYLSPRSSFFSLNLGIVLWPQKYWKVDFTTQIINRKLYRYDYEACGKFNEPYVDFWQNLRDGLSIFDYQALKRSFFQLQALNFAITHYINEWEMRVGFTLQRQLDTLRRIAYWEPQIRVEFMLSGTRDQFPPYTKRFIPEELQ
ncbi:LPS-assembly protein LptD [Thermospira aquatica]|uniref:LPS-assembly protein LptD n=1 Tax=Thermospira aquatica TaxID=2828656 RepID=A0AAX3BD24_9SPIR|nr:hypothetical protein [Thermospira aquatica]URA10076.1 hypothetical protein KDW03_11430 [Thermospira aquatica]